MVPMLHIVLGCDQRSVRNTLLNKSRILSMAIGQVSRCLPNQQGFSVYLPNYNRTRFELFSIKHIVKVLGVHQMIFNRLLISPLERTFARNRSEVAFVVEWRPIRHRAMTSSRGALPSHPLPAIRNLTEKYSR